MVFHLSNLIILLFNKSLMHEQISSHESTMSEDLFRHMSRRLTMLVLFVKERLDHIKFI